jgi:hypothetical protein
MRKFLVLLGLAGGILALLSFLWSKGSEPPFAKFTSKEGRFTAIMPGTPERTIKIVNGEAQVIHAATADNREYSVTYSDLASYGTFNAADSAKAIAKVFAGRLLSDAPCNFANTKGRQFEIQNPDGYVSGRLALINLRYYMILVAGPDARLSNPQVESFLNSFRWR